MIVKMRKLVRFAKRSVAHNRETRGRHGNSIRLLKFSSAAMEVNDELALWNKAARLNCATRAGRTHRGHVFPFAGGPDGENFFRS